MPTGSENHPCGQDGHAGQGNGENKAVGDEVPHRELQVEGVPEVAGHEVAEPVPVLEEDGLVQPIELPQRLRLLLSHELLVVLEDALDVDVDEVNLGHLDDEEADHGDGPHSERAQQDAPNQVVRQINNSSTDVVSGRGPGCGGDPTRTRRYASVSHIGDEYPMMGPFSNPASWRVSTRTK